MHTNPAILPIYQHLLTCRSEHKRLVLAQQVMDTYAHLDNRAKYAFFKQADTQGLWGYKGLCLLQAPSDHTLKLIHMRQDLLDFIPQYPALHPLDDIFKTFLQIVFNRCCLRFERIVWDKTPKAILQKIIAYEAIHRIDGLADLKNRIIWSDRLMYAYFHPLLGDEPLIFTEVALMQNTPHLAQAILARVSDRKIAAPSITDTAVFYGISKSHKGLTGIRFGNLLIKQVVKTIQCTYPHIDTFVTLSPIPHFTDWAAAQDNTGILDTKEQHTIQMLHASKDKKNTVYENARIMQKIIAKYIIQPNCRHSPNRVAHFHLGNGAEFHNIQILADENRMEESYGCMVNYRYRLDTVEHNIHQYFEHNKIAISDTISDILAS